MILMELVIQQAEGFSIVGVGRSNSEIGHKGIILSGSSQLTLIQMNITGITTADENKIYRVRFTSNKGLSCLND